MTKFNSQTKITESISQKMTVSNLECYVLELVQYCGFRFQGNLVAVMLSIFRQMDEIHFNIYLSCGDRHVGPFPAHFPTTTDLLDFLMEILLVFKDLVARPVFPSQWCEMIMLQNR